MILLDTNILLEILIKGRAQKEAVLEWINQNEKPYCITMLTVHLVLYFGLKDGLTLSNIKTFLSNYPKIALLPEDYVNAINIMKDTDNEDALQLVIAERVKCDSIATLDKKFSQIYQNRIQFVYLGN